MRRVILESPLKTCARCGACSSKDDFTNDKNRSDGKHPWCKSCARDGKRRSMANPKARDRMREYQRLWARKPENRAKNLARQKTDAGKAGKRRAKLKAKYGLTEAQYIEMLSRQEGVCAVCRDAFLSPKHTHTDHCHKSGRVRGILCHNCNRALGAVKDSPKILRSLISYLGEEPCAE